MTGWICTPIQPRVDRALVLKLSNDRLHVSAGIANAMPTLAAGRREDRRVDADDIAVDVEGRAAGLPLLIGASIWMKSSYGPAPMSRPRAETMPAVTVPPRPNGLPTASTQSPMRGAFSASFDVGEVVAAVDLDQREVGPRIGADDLGRIGLAVVGRDFDVSALSTT